MSHTYETNAAEIGQRFVDAIRSFGFTTTHEGKALGMVLAEGTAEGIRARTVDEQLTGDGSPLPLNSDRRRREKYKRNGECLTNVDTGQMLSIKSLMGKVIVEQYLVTIEYGTGEAAEATPDRMSPRQRIRITGGTATEHVTDVDKATFAAEQGRGFFQLDQTICDSNFKDFSAAFGAHLANPGR
jgi:hypothetical protein